MMVRIKSIYRAHGIRTSGSAVYQQKQREQWLHLLSEPGTRQRVSWLYEELDHLRPLRKQAKMAMVAEGRKHQAFSPTSNDPPIGADSLRHACRYGGHAISISHQTSAMGLQWLGDRHRKTRFRANMGNGGATSDAPNEN